MNLLNIIEPHPVPTHASRWCKDGVGNLNYSQVSNVLSIFFSILYRKVLIVSIPHIVCIDTHIYIQTYDMCSYKNHFYILHFYLIKRRDELLEFIVDVWTTLTYVRTFETSRTIRPTLYCQVEQLRVCSI